MSRKRNTRRRPAVEALEGRRLLTITYDPVSDVLQLDGTAANDTFAVSKVVVAGKDTIRVQEADVVRFLPVATKPITTIMASLRDGNDVLTVTSDVIIPLDASSGPGDDLIQGGGSTNTIHGDDGNDTITGGDGNDTLLGGDGNDLISGLAGDDVLRAFGQNDEEGLFSRIALHFVRTL